LAPVQLWLGKAGHGLGGVLEGFVFNDNVYIKKYLYFKRFETRKPLLRFTKFGNFRKMVFCNA